MKKRFLMSAAAFGIAATVFSSSFGAFARNAEIYRVKTGEDDENYAYCCIAEMKGKSLGEYEEARSGGVGDFVLTPEGKAAYDEIVASHEEAIEKMEMLLSRKPEVLYDYTAVYNGFAVSLSRREMNLIADNLDAFGFDALYLADTLDYGNATETFSSRIESNGYTYDDLTTDVLSSVGVDGSYKGSGTVIAVIDDSMDIEHEFFSLPEGAEPKLTREYVESIAPYLSAEDSGDIDFYYNEKIPFVYNYGNGTTDVSSSDCVHGTHVAGIAGGNGESETDEFYNAKGIAPSAQLLFMADNSLKNISIISAFDDCMYLGADVINASFGATGVVRIEEPYFEKSMNTLADCGIITCVSAGNDGRMYADGTAEAIDYSTCGSPGGINNCLAVGSAENRFTEKAYVQFDGDQYEITPFTGQDITKSFDGKTLDYKVILDSDGKSGFIEAELDGKIAVVKNGGDHLDVNVRYAKEAGAAGVLIYDTGREDAFKAVCDTIPGGVISKSFGAALENEGRGKLSFENKIVMEYDKASISDFSSWAFTEDLVLKPEITGFGGGIISSYPGNSYGAMSGTSMSAPQLSGVSALLREYLKENKENYGIFSLSDYTETAVRLLMSTAKPIYRSDTGGLASPRVQGSGLVNLKNAMETPAFLYTESEKDNFRPKISLGDMPDKNGVYEFEFFVRNISDEEQTYSLGADVFSDGEGTSTVQLDCKVVFTDGSGSTVSSVSVPPMSDAQVGVKITISADAMSELKEMFPYGTYIDGFINLGSTKQCGLTLPFMGFYGDWTEADIFEPFIYGKGSSLSGYMSYVQDGAGNLAGYNIISKLISGQGGKPEYSVPCFSPNGDGIMDEMMLDLYFKRRCYDVTAEIHGVGPGQSIYTQKLGNGNKSLNAYGALMPGRYSIDWNFRDKDGELHDGEMYTLVLTARIPGTTRIQMISQEFMVDMTPPTIESCIEMTVNGKHNVLIKASDNCAVHGGEAQSGKSGDVTGLFAGDGNSGSQYILLECDNRDFSADIYDMAGNRTTIDEDDLSGERYTLEYDEDHMFFKDTDKDFKGKISLKNSAGKNVGYNLSVTPLQVYKRGLDGFDLSLGNTVIKHIEASVGMAGDVNGDKSVDIFDAVYIARYTVNSKSEEYKGFKDSLEYALADTTSNGEVDIFDAVAIAKYTINGGKW